MHFIFNVLLIVAIAHGFYTSDGPVVVLTESNFEELVLNGNNVWMVEFYAPWCGHCKEMKDEWVKAAESMTGVAFFGAVDSTVEEKLASKYGVEGFPTIKVFSPAKKAPADFNDERNAKGFAKVAFAAVRELVNARMSGSVKQQFNGNQQQQQQQQQGKGKSTNQQQQQQQKEQKEAEAYTQLSQSDFESKVMKSDLVWMVLLCEPTNPKCKQLMTTWSKAATSAKGKAMFGYIDSSSNKDIVSLLPELKSYPAILSLAGGPKQSDSIELYEGQQTVEALVKHATGLYHDYQVELSKPITVSEITTNDQFQATCSQATCLLLLVPHILDAKSEKRTEMIQLFQTIASGQPKGMFKYGWFVGGSQHKMEDQLKYGSGYPAIFAIAGSKNRYAIHAGKFTEEDINVFIRGLQSGRVRTTVLPTLVPFETQTPWDGKDMELVDDDEI